MKSLAFYATLDASVVGKYLPDVPVLISATSFEKDGRLRRPPLPAHVRTRAADCGGYVAAVKWGEYRYKPEAYCDWLHTWEPGWAAMFDYCCEPDVLGGQLVRNRQERTLVQAELFWSRFREVPWAWMPTVQGWHPDDYRWHAERLAPLVKEMGAWYARCAPELAGEFRVGIGTLCRRADVPTIRQVVAAVASVLPGVPLHLWGVKGALFRSREAVPASVVSVDSAAWHGQFKRAQREENRVRRAEIGMTKQQYLCQVVLKRYRERVYGALGATKQMSLDGFLEVA